MPNEQLVAYIRSEFLRGVEKTELAHSLIAAGWQVDDINAAVAQVAPASVPPAPPVAPTAPTVEKHTAPVVYAASNSIKTLVQDFAAGLFIACVVILTGVAVMGIWKIFSSDVIWKSFETLGLLALVSVIAIVASRFVGDPSTAAEVAAPNPGYRTIRNITLGTLIVSSSLLAFLGVLAIWDVITSTDVLHKSLSSLGVIAFSSLIIVMVSLEREQNPFWKKRSGEMTGGAIIAAIILVWLLFAFVA